jgi:hypothetical protein
MVKKTFPTALRDTFFPHWSNYLYKASGFAFIFVYCTFAQLPQISTATPPSIQNAGNINGTETLIAFSQSAAKKKKLANDPKQSPLTSDPQGSAKSDFSNFFDEADSLIVDKSFHRSFINPELIQQAGFLWFEKDHNGFIYPGRGCIVKSDPNDRLKNNLKDIYRQFDEILISSLGNARYSVGDTVSVVHSDRFVKFKGKTANLLHRTAIARVSSVNGDTARAILFKAWDIVTGGDRIDSVFHGPRSEIDTIVECESHVKGTVFERVEQSESPFLFHTIILDCGAGSGVKFGDLFLVYPHQGALKPQRKPSALACALVVGEQSSTLLIEKLFDIALGQGDTAELVKRIRFK